MKKITYLIVLFILFSVFSGNAYSSECHLMTTPSNWINHENYAPPYNVFSSEQELLLKASCDGTQVTLTVGNGSENMIVHDTIQTYTVDSGSWTPVSLSGTRFGEGPWLSGIGNATITLTEQQLKEGVLYIAQTCSRINGVWKCGCKDNDCVNSFWQLQKISVSSCSAPPCLKIISLCSSQFDLGEPSQSFNCLPDNAGDRANKFGNPNDRYILMGVRDNLYAHALVDFDFVTEDSSLSGLLKARFALMNGTDGSLSPVGTGEIESDGTASGFTARVEVDARHVVGSLPTDYQLIVWVDKDQDDRVDEGEQVAVNSPGFFRIVTDYVYYDSLALARLGNLWETHINLAVKDIPIANEFLGNFVFPPPKDIQMGGLVFESEDVPLASVGNLDHNVGVSFSPDATIRSFKFSKDSDIAKEIRSSSALYLIVNETIVDNSQDYATLELFEGDQREFTWHTDVPNIEFHKLEDTDLHFSIGGASLQAEVHVTLLCSAGNLLIKSVDIVSGSVADIYDWDYQVSSLLDARLATIQAGFGTIGMSGSVFRHETDITGHIDFPTTARVGTCKDSVNPEHNCIKVQEGPWEFCLVSGVIGSDICIVHFTGGDLRSSDSGCYLIYDSDAIFSGQLGHPYLGSAHWEGTNSKEGFKFSGSFLPGSPATKFSGTLWVYDENKGTYADNPFGLRGQYDSLDLSSF